MKTNTKNIIRPQGEVTHYLIYATSNNCPNPLLAIQAEPDRRIIFKGIEITTKQFIAMLEQASLPNEGQGAHTR